jgi:hypothetical protein
MDHWDGNWLNVTVHCGASGASVWATGAILDIVSIARWGGELSDLHTRLSGEATLASHEPNLEASARIFDRVGHVALHVAITPDHLTQTHTFEFAVDQSYLADVARQCRIAVAKFPIRDPQRRGG